MLLAVIGQNPDTTYSVVSHGSAKDLFPNTSFRRDSTPNQEFLDANSAVVVDEIWRPAFDPTTQYITRVDPYVESGQNVVNHSAVNYTAEEIEDNAAQPYRNLDYTAFWQELIRSPVYTALKDAAKLDLAANVLATELISIFSDAKTNHLDIEAMQQGIWETVGALGAVDPALVTALSAIMTTHGLDIYTLTPPAS